MMGLIGKSVRDIRPLTDAEMEHEGWDGVRVGVMAIILDDGTKLYPSRDEEGNGPGSLFGMDPHNRGFAIYSPSCVGLAE